MSSELIDPNDVCTVPEIAKRLGVNHTTVQRWIDRKKNTRFPEPIKVSGKMRLYDYNKVFAWFERWADTRGGYYAKRTSS